MIDLRPAPGGSSLRVRVSPGAGRTRLLGPHGDALKVAVSEPPERGRATRAAAALLAEAFALKKGAVRLLSGETSRDKVFLLEGLSPAEARERLLVLLARP